MRNDIELILPDGDRHLKDDLLGIKSPLKLFIPA